MGEFYQWLIFQSFLIVGFAILYMYAAGMIKTKRTQQESFIEWRKTTGGMIRLVCILLIIVSIGIIIYKYYQVTGELNAPPTLNTD